MLVLAHRQRWTRAPAARRSSNSSPPKISANASYASFAFAIAARPRAASASSVPISSRYLSTFVSTRLTKKLATLATSDALAALVAAAEAGDVRARHALVDVDAEHQRHVDVDALGDRVLDGRDPGLGRRDLDEHVRPIQARPQSPRALQRRVGILGKVRLDLDAGEPIGPVGRVVDPAEDVGGVADVGDRDLLVDLARVVARRRSRAGRGRRTGRSRPPWRRSSGCWSARECRRRPSASSLPLAIRSRSMKSIHGLWSCSAYSRWSAFDPLRITCSASRSRSLFAASRRSCSAPVICDASLLTPAVRSRPRPSGVRGHRRPRARVRRRRCGTRRCPPRPAARPASPIRASS